ncbi:MAG: DnaD domain protein [Clostridia bacterium]
MSLASFSENFALYDVTPIENLFLLEYMPYAPGDAVRVYLYGLMLCRYPSKNDSIAQMAHALSLSATQVLDAMRYWESRGLVIGKSDNPPTFEYQNVRSAMLEHPQEENPAYAYSAFNQKLQAIFGLLHPQQFTAAMEWVEELKLPVDVVLYMCEQVNALLTLRNGGKPRSIGYAFKVLKDRAMDWAERKIDTLEKAQAEMQKELPPHRVSRRVLDQLGLRRNPTAAETQLCAKWLGEWGLTEEQVVAALSETTKSANPSFAYLDAILAGQCGAKDQVPGAAEQTREAVKAVLAALGAPSHAPTAALLSAYEGWLQAGFAPETILRAAGKCSARGQRTFEKLSDVLGKWLTLKLTTPEAADQYLARRAEMRTLTLSIFEKAGITREPTDADLDRTQEWLAFASPELIECAADCVRGFRLPESGITKRLGDWMAAGIHDVEAAKAFKAQRKPSGEAGAGSGASGGTSGASAGMNRSEAPRAALNYAQRTYESDYFDDFFADLTTPGKDEPK